MDADSMKTNSHSRDPLKCEITNYFLQPRMCILIYFMMCNYSLAHFGSVCPRVFSSVCRYENLFHFSSLPNDRTVTSLVGLS